MHIAPSHEKYNHKINVFENRVTNIHNCDMDGRSFLADGDYETTNHDSIWTNSLYLYPERVRVKVFDHKKGRWLEERNREIRPNPVK